MNIQTIQTEQTSTSDADRASIERFESTHLRAPAEATPSSPDRAAKDCMVEAKLAAKKTP